MEVQHDPCREIVIIPKTIKTLPNGTKVVVYNWQGAELVKIAGAGGEKEIVYTAYSVGKYR